MSDDIPFDKFYRPLNYTESSLVRVRANSLTYSLRIIIRYEIERMTLSEGVDVVELFEIWDQKHGKYLGIRPTDDMEGILQDAHWSGASSGYFPSCALGYMYATQLLHSLQREIDVESVLASDDYSLIKDWMSKHIHQYGALGKPSQLIMDATHEPLNP